MKPNFLLAGATKCGTTTLYYYLKQHPEIFMSGFKEPHFFSDMPDIRSIKDWNQYIHLFDSAKNEKIIGEASSSYFYHYKTAIPKIKQKLGNPKILIILRNPAKRTFSAYMHNKMRGDEPLNFRKALDAEATRKKQTTNLVFFYKDVSLYSKPTKAFITNFKNTKIILLDDLKNNPKAVMKQVYKFLDVDPTFIPDTSYKYMVSGIPKNKLIHKLLTSTKINNFLRPLFHNLGIDAKIRGIAEKIREKNFTKPTLSEQDKLYLQNFFKSDIKQLSKLIKRDLSGWLK